MHLTLINYFIKTNRIPGHIFRGKKKIVKQVTPEHTQKTKQAFELQERNMQLLLRPYLTQEESSGHAKMLKKTEQKMKFWRESKLQCRDKC